MARALRICGAPNCPHLATASGRCAAHTRPAWRTSTASSSARGYGSAHARRRRDVLLEERVCFYCRRELLEFDVQMGAWRPIPGVATLDHKRPKAEGGGEERANLCAACVDCQKAKASREGARARGAAAA